VYETLIQIQQDNYPVKVKHNQFLVSRLGFRRGNYISFNREWIYIW